MIVHASIAKLYKHLWDTEFSRVMRHIEGAQEEGLTHFELEVDRLDHDMRLDLIDALEIAGYLVTFDTDREMFEVGVA